MYCFSNRKWFYALKTYAEAREDLSLKFFKSRHYKECCILL